MADGKKIGVAIVGSGNIGTDLMVKLIQRDICLELKAVVGIDPASDGLAKARGFGLVAIDNGLTGLLDHPIFADIAILFDATSAKAHHIHAKQIEDYAQQNLAKNPDYKQCALIDLTPAAIGPFVVPTANMDEHLGKNNVNMVSCGGQATIPIVRAVADVAKVHYAEIVASISSLSAGPGTRANIDEFTQTTKNGLEIVGGAEKGKAIIVLNPAEPPLMMRDTIYTLSVPADEDKVRDSIKRAVAAVQHYVPGYRLKQEVQFEHIGDNNPVNIPGLGKLSGLKTSVFIEVEGAGDYLPKYAGNLDVMTSAAMATGEQMAMHMLKAV